MNDIIVGVVTIKYNENGDTVYANFQPEAQEYTNPDFMHSLLGIPASSESEMIKTNAQHLLVKYFTKINDMDMADHFEYGFVGDVIQCDRYDSGQVKECKIKFTFKKIV